MKIILDFTVNYIVQSLLINPEGSLSENGLTIPDLKEVIRDQALAEDRFENWRDWAKWFNLSDSEKTDLIKQARKDAKSFTA